jgi:ArsR family transcriptional regulator, arsenate/arsenite/antimonite-responsive transcriptional repressor
MKIDEERALNGFSALSQPTRLQMLRMLVVEGPAGLAAGDIAAKAGVSSSGASFHLAHLERAGLISSRREARSIIYRANLGGLSGLVEFLMADCCQGHPEVCLPAANAAAAACCAPGVVSLPLTKEMADA